MNGDYTIIPSNRIEDTLNELASIMINFRINKHNFKINVTNELGLSDVIFSQIFSRFKIYGSNRNMKFPDVNVNEITLCNFLFKCIRQRSYPKVCRIFIIQANAFGKVLFFSTNPISCIREKGF